MNKNKKLEFCCKICNQILQEPISLPCKHAAICKHHLLNQPSFKCRQCSKSFQSEDILIEIDAELQNKLDKNDYLSHNEILIKHQLNSMLNEIEKEQEEFSQLFFKFELNSYENFAEMRRLIDLKREETENLVINREENDLKYLQMIEVTQHAEKYFQQTLNEAYRPSLHIEEFNVVSQRNMLNEIFRQMNVSVTRLERLLRENYQTMHEKLISKRNDLNRLYAQMKECKYDEKNDQLHLETVNDLIKLSQTMQMITCSGDHTIKLWNLKNGECLKTFSLHTAIVHKLEAFTSKRSFASCSNDKTIRVWHLNESNYADEYDFYCAKTFTNDDENGIRCLKLLNIENQQIVIANSYNRLNVWDLDKSERIHVLVGHMGNILCMELISGIDETLLISADQDGRIKVWSLKSLSLCRGLLAHRGDILCLKTLKSNDSNNFASGSKDKTIKIWNVLTGVCLRILDGHFYAVSGLDTNNKNELISCSWDKTIKIWSLSTGECIKTLVGHTQAINCVRVCGEGFLLSGSSDSTVKMWDLTVNECVQTFAGHGDTIRDLILF